MPTAQAVFIVCADYKLIGRSLPQSGYKFFYFFSRTEIYAKTAYPRLGKFQGFFYIALAEPKSGMYQSVGIHCFITHPMTELSFAPVALGHVPARPFKVSHAKYANAAASLAIG